MCWGSYLSFLGAHGCGVHQVRGIDHAGRQSRGGRSDGLAGLGLNVDQVATPCAWIVDGVGRIRRRPVFGDGVITPAVSVLSAVEGLEAITPNAKPYVVPLSLVVLVALFMVQRRGTADIGKFFGPVTVIWFGSIAVAGIFQILQYPTVLAAVSPLYAIHFAVEHYHLAFLTLGAVFLCLTGAEALYADMGHFGKTPIRIAWFGLVMPSLMLNYFGQGALVLMDPSAADNPFFNMMPDWALIPMVGLATAATVIASQALITGAFSATKQTIQLGFLPRLTILHTSIKDTGQIYIPAVNWALLLGVVAAVAFFGSSSALAAAYGISVSMVMIITTFMTFYVVRYGWGFPLPICIASTGLFLSSMLPFFIKPAENRPRWLVPIGDGRRSIHCDVHLEGGARIAQLQVEI